MGHLEHLLFILEGYLGGSRPQGGGWDEIWGQRKDSGWGKLFVKMNCSEREHIGFVIIFTWRSWKRSGCSREWAGEWPVKKKLFGAKKTSLFGFLVKNVKVCFTLTLTMMKRTTRRSPGLMFRRKHFLHIWDISPISIISYVPIPTSSISHGIICPDTTSYIVNPACTWLSGESFQSSAS